MDLNALRAKLNAELHETTWDALEPHHQRGALFMIDAALSLVEVALAAASNQARVVAAWIDAGHIRRPHPDAVARWGAQPQARLRFIIVQPHVFAQPVTD